MRFIVIKKKMIVCCLAILLMLSVVLIFFAVRGVETNMPKPEHTIVIDAGHGGRDGGTVGSGGAVESRLNLDFALTLKQMCESFGFGVVMTRSSMDGLYDENASNKKRSEMEKRKQIIEESDADIMISLHMNGFPLPSAEGAQVFYGKGNEGGKALAESVTESLSRDFESARDYCTIGDYFVLNCTEKAGVLVECGFLSNPSEEKLLQSREYRQKFCYSLLYGIITYFQM